MEEFSCPVINVVFPKLDVLGEKNVSVKGACITQFHLGGGQKREKRECDMENVHGTTQQQEVSFAVVRVFVSALIDADHRQTDVLECSFAYSSSF